MSNFSRNRNVPRFKAQMGKDGKAHIYDDDFHWDAMLVINGDFEDDAQKLRYAEAIAKVLTDAGDAIPSEPGEES